MSGYFTELVLVFL